jgi:DeoR family transcriptional regulator, suf operon transcriptional repressor
MRDLGNAVSSSLESRVQGKTSDERVHETVKIMNELRYEAQLGEPDPADRSPAIEATNCVYHALASGCPEICQFDLAILSRLTSSDVTHEKCIVRGENICRFKLAKRDKKNR